jgi:8-oxo-dGTP pyrophosphatase MutT (NUDIX family)
MGKDRPAWLKPHGRPWVDHGGREVYANPWIRVTEHPATAPSGAPATYGKVHFKNLALAVLPLHDDGTVTLVGQHRFSLGDYQWELPEGGGPHDEDPLEAARRELREETGLEAAEWRPVLRMQLSNSVTDERGVGYIATGLTHVGADPEETEDLALARRPFREVLDAALAGHIVDVMTIALLLRAYQMANEGELPADMARRMLEGGSGAAPGG